MDFTIHFEPSHRSVRVPAGTTLLEAARQVGLPVASSCGQGGVCGRCGFEILEGIDALQAEDEHERDVKRRNRIDPKLRLSCRLGVGADLSVTAPYW